MDFICELVRNNFALLLSTLVSIFSIGVNCYQVRAGKKEKIMSMYFSAQLDAYRELYRAIGQLEGFLSDENVGKFVAAGQTAMLVSTHKNAEIISHFMAVFLDYVRDREQGKVTQARVDEFVQARKMLEFFLREEMYRYDTMKRPLDKHLGYRKDQQSDKHYADD